MQTHSEDGEPTRVEDRDASYGAATLPRRRPEPGPATGPAGDDEALRVTRRVLASLREL